MKKILLISAVILFLSNNGFSQEAWSLFHGCEKRCGIYPVSEYRKFGKEKWVMETEGKIFSSPAIYKGMVYIGSEDGYLYAIDENDGAIKWKYKTQGAIHATPALFENKVYFGSFDGHYYALDAATGELKWRFKTGGEKFMGGLGYWNMEPADEYLNDPWAFYLSSPVIDRNGAGQMVYFGSSDGNLYAIDADNGKLIWKYKTQDMIHSSPALYNGKVYFGSWDSHMYAVDAKTGKEIWKFKTGSQEGMRGIQASPSIDEGKAYFGARDGFFYCLDAEDGTLKWKYDAGNSWILSTAAIKDGVVYFGTSDSYLLVALGANSGEELFRFKTNGYVYSSPALAGNTAFFGDFTGNMFALGLKENGTKWQVFETPSRRKHASKVLHAGGDMDFQMLAKNKDMQLYSSNVEVMDELYSLGAIVSSPALGEGVIYFSAADGKVYAVELKEKALEADGSSNAPAHH